MNKKALVMLYFCLVGFVLAIILFYGSTKDHISGGETYYLGEKEVHLFEVYQEQENKIFFIEQSARLSALSASQENFQSEFESKFSKYLEGTGLTLQDYSLSYKTENNQMTIIGICSKDLEVKETDFTYTIKPNFKVVVPYSVEDSENLFV